MTRITILQKLFFSAKILNIVKKQMIRVGKHYLMHVHKKLNPYPEYTIGINAKTERNLATSLD